MRETKQQKILGRGVAQQREEGDTRETELPVQANHRRMSGNRVKAQGGEGGGKQTRNDGRCRHAARGSEMRGRVWRGAGVEDVHLDDVPRQESRWITGETERCYDNK